MSLFNCRDCRQCCHGYDFEVPAGVPLARAEVAPRNTVVTVDGQRFLKVIAVNHHPQCVHYDMVTSDCGIYDQRPIVCRLFPLTLADQELVLWKSCPDAEGFAARYRAGDAEAVAFIAEAQVLLAQVQQDASYLTELGLIPYVSLGAPVTAP